MGDQIKALLNKITSLNTIQKCALILAALLLISPDIFGPIPNLNSREEDRLVIALLVCCALAFILFGDWKQKQEED